MRVVVRPAVDPPRLDKFCHLSHDAQIVMAALYSDYHKRKQELLEVQRVVKDSSTYYQSIYAAKFGSNRSLTDTQEEMHKDPYLQHSQQVPVLENIKTTAYSDKDSTVYQSFSSANIYSKVDAAGSGAKFNKDKNEFVYTARKLSFNDDSLKKSTYAKYQVDHYPQSSRNTHTSPDTSRYPDSPPIETQDYRLLSQFHQEDPVCDTVDVSHSCVARDSITECTENNKTCNNFLANDSVLCVNNSWNMMKSANPEICEQTVTGMESDNSLNDRPGGANVIKDKFQRRTSSSITQAEEKNKQSTDIAKDGNGKIMKIHVMDNAVEKLSANIDGSQCLFSQETSILSASVVGNRSFRHKPSKKKCTKLQKMYDRSKSILTDSNQRYDNRKGSSGNLTKRQQQCRNIRNKIETKRQLVTDYDIDRSDIPINRIEYESNSRLEFNQIFKHLEDENFIFNPMFESDNRACESGMLEDENYIFNPVLKNDDRPCESGMFSYNNGVSIFSDKIKTSASNAEYFTKSIAAQPDRKSRNREEKNDSTGIEIELDVKLDNLTVNEENPLGKKVGTGNMKEIQIKSTNRQENDEGTLEESPYLKGKTKLYPVFDTAHNRDVENVRWLKPAESKSSGKKRRNNGNGFEIPVKKSRYDCPSSCNMDKKTSYKCSRLVNISSLSGNQLATLFTHILDSEEVLIVTVYQDASTQLRENLFGKESKKRQTSKMRHCSKVESIAVTTKSSGEASVYMFPVDIPDEKNFETIREFWNKMLSGKVRKVGFHVKELYTELMICYKFDQNKVNTSWTVLDPSLAVWLLDPDKPVSTFEQVLRMLKLPMQAPGDSSINALHGDMMLLSASMEHLFQHLQRKELWSLFICVETKLTPLLAGMELRNLHIATHTLLQFSEILKKKLLKLEQQAHQAAGHAFLLSSHAQLRQVLFEKLRLDTKLPQKSKLAKTSVGRETSTSEAVLTQLSPFHSLPGIVLEHRQLQKLKSTYIDGILSCVNEGTLTTHWDQTAAATGRLTSYQPNIQAIPKVPFTITGYQDNYITGRDETEQMDIYARDPFISRKGWSLLAADFQQIELRLLGHLADDPTLVKIFNDPDVPDIFNALTSQWLTKPVDRVTVSEREQTKRVVYSVMYGAGKDKLAEYLKISAENAKAIMASFLLRFPAVSQFTKTCVDFCQRNGYTCSIFKRRRLFPNIKHPSPPLRAQAERQCVNFSIQGSAADICKAAMLQVETALADKQLYTRLLVQIHDEILLEVADTDLLQVTALVKTVMESREKLCGSMLRLKVPLPVSLSVGKKWGHMETFIVQQKLKLST